MDVPGRKPLVSIVTPTFKRAQYLEATIVSVLEQSYPRIEYIVVDGGSGDDVLSILLKYETQLTWISEPDKGQAHAINKGMRMASGEFLAYLNSDDLYTSRAVEMVMDAFHENPEAMVVYGDALAIDEAGRSYGIRRHVQACTHDRLLQVGNLIVQPAAFWRASLWHEIGEFDESYPYTFDYEWWIRASQRNILHYVQLCLAKERLYAASKTSQGGLKRIQELDRLGRHYGGAGIAANYRPEGAATYIHTGVKKMLRGQWQSGRQHVREGLRMSNSPVKLLMYLMSMLLFGAGAVPRLRLYSNQIRGWLRKESRVCE